MKIRPAATFADDWSAAIARARAALDISPSRYTLTAPHRHATSEEERIENYRRTQALWDLG